MKTPGKVTLLLLGSLLTAAVGVPGSRALGGRRDYGQAEPLVQSIWPMAEEMQRFSQQHGRPPASLDEIARFSPDHDVSALRAFPHEFSSTGPRRFFLRVNRRFAFTIDEGFKPSWSQPAAVLAAPTTPP